MDLSGIAITFGPQSSLTPTATVVDAGTEAAYGVACPSLTECATVDATGHEITFNPQSPGSPTPTVIDGGHQLQAVACPASAQCTAVDEIGREVTFNPNSPGTPAALNVDNGHGLESIACPASAQCTAIDDSGAEVSFDPLAPGHPAVITIDSNPAVSLACPAASQCTAVDAGGQQVTFDPQTGRASAPVAIDGSTQLNSVACRTPTDCVAVDADGQTLEGDPRGGEAWTVQPVAAGNSLPALACPSVLECIAVDLAGDGYVGTGGPLPAIPTTIAPPRIAGRLKQGQRLSDLHGGWSSSPTSYVYQWMRCNVRGGGCAPIMDASGETYQLAAGDVGHTIRLDESASNITGTSAPRTSARTAVVRPAVAVAASRMSLSGVAKGRPKLALTLTAGPGEKPLKTIELTLPSVLLVTAAGGARGVTVKDVSTAKFALSAKNRTLTIRLRRRARTVRITIGHPLVGVSSAIERRVRVHKLKTVQLKVRTAGSGGAHTRLRVRVRVK
jgi:hypothetical protein